MLSGDPGLKPNLQPPELLAKLLSGDQESKPKLKQKMLFEGPGLLLKSKLIELLLKML